MSYINDILNMLYYIDEDIKNIIINNEKEKDDIKKILKKLDYVYNQVKKLK